MKLKYLNLPFEIKSLEKDGSFAGHASTFNNVDLHRDAVMPGAFQETLANWAKKGKLPPVLWQHDTRQPLGPHTKMAEDDKGLYVEGQMLIDDVPQARTAYALVKSGAIDGMSIGYVVPEGGEEWDSKAKVNRLKKVNLWENSIVTFPANVEASVTGIKSLLDGGALPTIREFESHLRDAGGFSKKQAQQIAVLGYVEFLKQRDAEEGGGDSSGIDEAAIDRLANFISNLKVA